MTQDKLKVVQGLHTLQDSIYDAKQYLQDIKTSPLNAVELAHLNIMLQTSEVQLELILDADFWE